MPAKDKLSAYVRVDGSCLPEYDVELQDDGKTIACWIPSEAGKIFDICATNASPTSTISVIARVDGINSPEGRFLRAQQPLTLGGAQQFGPKLPSAIINGFPGKSMDSIQPFVFSPCILIEEDGEARSTSNEMGQIELCIWEAIPEETTYLPNLPTLVTIPPLHINERAKKGIVHGIQLGEEVSVPTMGPWRRVKWVKEILKFVFKYRPIGEWMHLVYHCPF
ncbi:hypothetical protein BJ165DRAFT_1507745 [Panaeolus papilionaceus]|nr:hypothetical protein BJ165DRAFT_1507745 [Panaeolus papilionaceus]